MWTIFTRDIRKIRTNVIALIVVLGVTVVPCLYAWFNIAASWDPYGNTGNLKVAECLFANIPLTFSAKKNFG